MRSALVCCVAGLALAATLTARPARAQQAFTPSPRVQNDLRLTAPVEVADEAPSPTDMAWMALGLDALFNLGSVAAAAAITGGVATLEIVNLGTAGSALAFLDVAMIAVQPLGQAFLVYEVGRMNPRYEPQFGWTLAGAYGGTLLAGGLVAILAAAIPGGGPALTVLATATLVVVPSVTTVLVQSATMVERPLASPTQPVATLRF